MLRLEVLSVSPALFPFIIPTLNCRVQESKTSLSEDREALGVGKPNWVMTEQGPQVPAPPGEKRRIVLDKFGRTGPASPGLGMLLLLFDFAPQITAGGIAPWGLCWECGKFGSCMFLPARTPPLPHAHRCVYPHRPHALSQVCPGAPLPTP